MVSSKAKLQGQTKRQWFQIDVANDTYGRVASKIANLLRGKHKRNFLPQADSGDFVVAINVDKLKFSGRKLKQKKYYRHSGFLGGLKSSTLQVEYQKNPDNVLRRAVYNMLDDLRFRKALIARLKLVEGPKHDFKIDKHL
jgi:large subunit ribosomal protein L13